MPSKATPGKVSSFADIENSRPSDLVKELESVFKAYSLTEKSGGTVKFLPVDRINTISAVSPNPRIFEDVQKWIEKLDGHNQPVQLKSLTICSQDLP